MIYPFIELQNYEIKARDGVLGSVKDLYFDDEEWRVRYFIVETGSWLSGRRVLLPAARVTAVQDARRMLSVDATQEQVRNSPPVDADRPVSRQHEQRLHDSLGWPYYWNAGPAVGATFVPAPAVAADIAPTPAAIASDSRDRRTNTRVDDRRRNDDPHLRSVREVRGYRIGAEDGAMGEVEDVLIDDATWQVRYLVVDTRRWLPGRTVIIAPEWIQNIGWADKEVAVSLTRDEVKNSPPFDPSTPVSDAYTDRLLTHYRPRRTR